MIRTVLVALVLVVVLAGSASAECAWVLWAKIMILAQSGESLETWHPSDSFNTRADCAESERLTRTKTETGLRTTDLGTKHLTVLVCLPDTVDPRGPKGR